MSKFEDHLWREVVSRHGPDLEVARRPPAKHRRPGPRVLAGTTLGLAGAGTALALVLGATVGTTAFAVTREPDGTVTLTIKQLAGITGANAKLATLGVRARAVPVIAGCTASPVVSGLVTPPQSANPPLLRTHRPSPAFVSVRIDPSKIPAGETLVLAANQSSRPYVTMLAQEMVRGPVPSCLGNSPPPPQPTPVRGSCRAVHNVPLPGGLRRPQGFGAVQLNAGNSGNSTTGNSSTAKVGVPAIGCRVPPAALGTNGNSGSGSTQK
jgi:hypothetical protein